MKRVIGLSAAIVIFQGSVWTLQDWDGLEHIAAAVGWLCQWWASRTDRRVQYFG